MNEGGQGGCLYEWMEWWKIDGTSPPLLLHAGGGGGAGDMPCLPHLDQRGQLEILMIVRKFFFSRKTFFSINPISFFDENSSEFL